MKGGAIGGPTAQMLEQLLGSVDALKGDAKKLADGKAHQSKEQGGSFTDELMRGVKAVNDKQIQSDRMAVELASGKTGNIHETMLAATQAELSFNLMVQVRNKALEAYTEIMRMPV